MSFWAAWKMVFARSGEFLLALPVLGLLIIGFEGAQHVVEWLGGMYASKAGFLASAHDQGRLIFGSFKVVWLVVVGFWVARFYPMAETKKTLRPSATAIRCFAPVLAISVALSLALVWTPVAYPLAAGWIGAAAFITFPLGVGLTPWLVGAALGDPRANPIFAFRRAWGSIWWGLGLTLAAILPLMIPHYVLGYAALWVSKPVAVAMLAADAVLVALLGVVAQAVNPAIASRMAARAGETLVVDPAQR